MARTVISLPDEDKAWLDRQAAREGVPMTELIRRAVRRLRVASRRGDRTTEELLDITRGTWKRGDGIKYQRALRREW